MKRSFAFFALVCAILFGCAATADAQSKALKKDVKKRVKELTKEGWKPLAEFFYAGVCFFQVPHVSGGRSGKPHRAGRYCHRQECKNRQRECHNERHYQLCFQSQSTGCRQDERLMSSEASSTPEEEIDKFGAAYESGVNTKIAGLVKQHLVLVKENKDGSKEFNVYMSIDEPKQRKPGKRLRWRLKNRQLWVYSPSKWRSLSANR